MSRQSSRREGSVLKLPRAIEADPRRAAIEATLARDVRPLWTGGALAVSHVAFGAPLQAALLAAMNAHQVQRGLEQLTGTLASEQKGLDALRARQGGPPVDRASRLLVVAEDGSERFYRQVEALLLRHADRLLGLRVLAASSAFSLPLFGPDALVKALLVTDRDGVVSVLRALDGA